MFFHNNFDFSSASCASLTESVAFCWPVLGLRFHPALGKVEEIPVLPEVRISSNRMLVLSYPPEVRFLTRNSTNLDILRPSSKWVWPTVGCVKRCDHHTSVLLICFAIRRKEYTVRNRRCKHNLEIVKKKMCSGRIHVDSNFT